jgi:hypothetical protein
MTKENETPLTLADVVSLPSTTMRDIIVKCASEDDATMLACLIFDDDDGISSVRTSGNHVLVGYAITNNFAAKSKRITALAPPGVAVLNLGRQQLAGLSVEWTLLDKRVIAQAAEPAPLDGFINNFKEGRWYRRPAEKYMLGEMVGHMAWNSKQRGHAYYEAKALTMLRAAVPADGRCGCGKGPDGQCPVIMTTFGKHAASPDRRHDPLGYTDEGQVLTLVAKEHNTPVRHTADMRPRANPVRWISVTGGNASERLVDRMEKLGRKERKSECEEQQLVRFRTKTRLGWNRAFQTALLARKAETPYCARPTCGEELHYGDEKGMLRFTNHPQQASPDRLENSNAFYDYDNIRLVCLCCQHTEHDYSRVSLEAERTKQGPVPFVAANWIAAIDARIAKLAK